VSLPLEINPVIPIIIFEMLLNYLLYYRNKAI
jgi:hypothetical protein